MTQERQESKPEPFDLDRFVAAQEDTFDLARRELAAGRKQSHWMWFVFPQMRGLGISPTSQHYGIASLAEARAYLAHPVLGARLEEVTRLVLGHEGRSPAQIFGPPDDLKFRSAMTLFAAAAGSQSLYQTALERLCAGTPCAATLALIEGQP